MDYRVWAHLAILSITLVVSTQGQKCGPADTGIPEYPHKINETVSRIFRGYTATERKNNTKFMDMFKEYGITRRCVTWQGINETTGDDCLQDLTCRTMACFSHLEGETVTNVETEFAVELFGFAPESQWISLALSNLSDVPPRYALQIECIRKDNNTVAMQVVYLDSNGKKILLAQDEIDTFLRFVDYSAEPIFKGRLYCKAYVKVSANLSTGLNLDFQYQKYIPISSVGEKYREVVADVYEILGPCSTPLPNDSMYIFRPFGANRDDQKNILIHAWLMIFAMVVLFPCSIYPIRYLKFAHDNVLEDWNMKRWLFNHIVFAIWFFPVMFVSVIFARRAKDNQFRFQAYHKFGHYGHGTAGVICYQIFGIQFFIGLFGYPFLRRLSNILMVRVHYLMNYVGYAVGCHVIFMLKIHRYTTATNPMYMYFHFYLWMEFLLHFFMTFYLFFFKDFPIKDEKFVHHANIPTVWQVICQDTREIQRLPFPSIPKILWKAHIYACFGFALGMMVNFELGHRYHPSTRVLTPNTFMVGQVFIVDEWWWSYS